MNVNRITKWLSGSALMLLTAVAATPAQSAPRASYAKGELKLYMPAADLTPRIEEFLNKKFSGHVIDSDTRRADLHNFRATFHNGCITIRCEYRIKERGHTNGPFGTTIYGPWVSDSGWLEMDVHTAIENGMLKVVTNHEHIRWNTKNWFTGAFREVFDRHVANEVVAGVNRALTWAVGGGSLGMQGMFLSHGVPQAAATLGMTPAQAQAWMTENFGKLTVTAGVDGGGVYASLPLNPGLFVRNNHREAVKVAVRYQDHGKWVMSDWVNVPPGQGTFVTDHGHRVMPQGNTVYYHAEGRGAGWNWHGDQHFAHEGHELPMRMERLTIEPDGRAVFTVQHGR